GAGVAGGLVGLVAVLVALDQPGAGQVQGRVLVIFQRLLLHCFEGGAGGADQLGALAVAGGGVGLGEDVLAALEDDVQLFVGVADQLGGVVQLLAGLEEILLGLAGQLAGGLLVLVADGLAEQGLALEGGQAGEFQASRRGLGALGVLVEERQQILARL